MVTGYRRLKFYSFFFNVYNLKVTNVATTFRKFNSWKVALNVTMHVKIIIYMFGLKLNIKSTQEMSLIMMTSFSSFSDVMKHGYNEGCMNTTQNKWIMEWGCRCVIPIDSVIRKSVWVCSTLKSQQERKPWHFLERPFVCISISGLESALEVTVLRFWILATQIHSTPLAEVKFASYPRFQSCG